GLPDGGDVHEGQTCPSRYGDDQVSGLMTASSSGVPVRRPAVLPAAFDAEAPTYDQKFSSNPVALRARAVVWDMLKSRLGAGDHVLEINCGTGEDALMLARLGIKVTATDSSAEMISASREKVSRHGMGHLIDLKHLRFEELISLNESIFDG